VIALDDYLDPRRPIGIIQFDLKEYERLALMGAIRTIERHRPVIILETVPAKWVTEHLLPLGYREICKLHGNTAFAMEGARIVMVPASLERRPG
jgi:hypothetical protein